MTDEMAIQGQRPSAMPYVLGGAAAGAGIGALATMGNFGLKSPAYSSWEDAVADVNKDDSFVKKQIDKGGDNKASWEEIKNQAEAIKAKEKVVNDLKLGDGVKAEDFKALAEKEVAADSAKTALKDAAINSEIKRIIDGKVEYAIEESKLPSGFTKPADWPAAAEGKIKLNAEQTKKLFESTAEADKNLVRSLVEGHAEVEGFINGEKKGALTDEMLNALKDKRTAVETADKAVTTAKDGLSENAKKVSEDLRKSAVNALKDVETAKNTAKEKLSKELLGKCEKASGWKNALAGAVVLGLAGLLVRPKGDDAIEA